MRVLLIDDHPLILSALQNVIQGMGEAGDVAVVGVAGARAARAALGADDSFDLVLLDLRLGDADGFDLLVELRNGWPAIPVVVVSASDRSADVIRAIDLGAMGFVPKRASNETLMEALGVVMSGGIYVPPMTMGDRRRCVAGRARAQRPGARRRGGAAERARRVQADAAPDRSARPSSARLLEQADRARARPLGRDRQGPRRRRAARPRCQLADAGGACGQPAAEPGSRRAMALAADALSAAGGAPPVAVVPDAAASGRERRPCRRRVSPAARSRPRHLRVQPHLARRPCDRRDHRRDRLRRRRAARAVRRLGRRLRDRLADPRRARRALRARRADDGRRARAAPAHLARRRPRVGRALGRRRMALLGVRKRAAPACARPRRLHLLRRQRADPGAAVPRSSSSSS